jgi:hypothetical protein
MKHLSKECKNIKQVNQYLKSIGLDDFSLDPDNFCGEFDHDGWLDSSENKGASIQVTKRFEVLVVKYTKEDIEKLEAELLL